MKLQKFVGHKWQGTKQQDMKMPHRKLQDKRIENALFSCYFHVLQFRVRHFSASNVAMMKMNNS